MSVSPMWLLSVVTDDRAQRCRARFHGLVDAKRRDGQLHEGLRVWRTLGDIREHLAPGAAGFNLDEAAMAVHEVLAAAQLDWPDVHRLLDELDPSNDPVDSEIHVTRKLYPAAVLLVGLGWERARRLPGFMGSYLLDAGEVKAGLSDIEATFAMTESEREGVLETMARWEANGDAAPIDLGAMLDAIPRLHRRAAARGMGIVSLVTVPS